MEELQLVNRRSFIKNIALAGLSVPFISALPLNKKIQSLVILHTNDMHSHIDPFSNNNPKYNGKGGMRRIASLVKTIRAQEENVLLLDAGDIFQGTAYFNQFKGVLEFKIMSEMGYNASTMGNHDFDNGIEGFNKVLHHAKFPFICSNYDFSNTILKDKTEPFTIKKYGALKVGVIGIGIKLEGLVDKNLYKNTKYLEPLETANYWAQFLKKEKGCQLIICLSHLGYKYDSEKTSDLKLARNSKNIDIIIGGHTHTFLKNATIIKNLDNKDVIINQAGWGALSLGRIDLSFENKKSNDNQLSIKKTQKKNYAKI